jgi:hypothetical protein
MSELEGWIVPVTCIVALLGSVCVLLWASRQGRGRVVAKRDLANIQELPCSVCHRTLVISPTQLQLLSPAEIALAVRARPQLVRQRLAEHVCPFCEAAHCFVLSKGAAEWVGVNLYQPQQRSANCFECRTPLRAPSWPRGTYDGRISEAPAVLPDHGLLCARCHAVCCYACCESTARRRGLPGGLVCPRCMRAGIEAFYHP